jgi:dihydrofolate reductase
VRLHLTTGASVIRLIAAIDNRRGIADEHGIPWQGLIPMDTKYFREQTAEGTIVMGRRTYEEFDRPLHDRENFVISRPDTAALRPGFVGVTDLGQFLLLHAHEVVWVLGGAVVFSASLPAADELFITQLDADFHCTKFFPRFDDDFLLASDLGPHVENDVSYRFQVWRRQQPSSSEVSSQAGSQMPIV